MAEIDPSFDSTSLILVEPGSRLVVLARTIEVLDPVAESKLKDSANHFSNYGETCLGRALYRHHTIFQNASEAPVWSHFELSYFRDIVPADAILDLAFDPQPSGMNLLRAEILLTTPSSFILPRGWQGSAGERGRKASLEFLQVQPKYLSEYRNAMRDYCGPAARKLVAADRFGTFRAMETATVLFQSPELKTEWNQVHLCELDPDDFKGFGKEFKTALREDLPGGTDLSDTFADLGRLRTIPRWTFNDPIVEADLAIALDHPD